MLDCKACLTHWTGCQVGQVVSLLGQHYDSHSELLTTAIRHVSWVKEFKKGF